MHLGSLEGGPEQEAAIFGAAPPPPPKAVAKPWEPEEPNHDHTAKAFDRIETVRDFHYPNEGGNE